MWVDLRSLWEGPPAGGQCWTADSGVTADSPFYTADAGACIPRAFAQLSYVNLHDQAVRDAQIAASQQIFPAVVFRQFAFPPFIGSVQETRDQIGSVVFNGAAVAPAIVRLPRFLFALQDATPWDAQIAASSVVFNPIAAENIPVLLARFIFAGLPDELQRDLQIAASSAVYAPSPIAQPSGPTPALPVAGGTVPGFVPGKKKRKGPYMRAGQVFGEEYPVSPFLGQKSPKVSKSDLKLADPDYHEIVIALMKELL